MSYILLTIAFNVVVSVILKLTSRFKVDVRQAIGGSYVISILLCMGLLNPDVTSMLHTSSSSAWGILLALGFLLPGMFLVDTKSIKQVGITRTDAARRLSLILPIITAFTLFGEVLTWQKGVGVTIGLIAIACLVDRYNVPNKKEITGAKWYWPLIVFVGSGIIDILFKGMAEVSSVPFTDVLLSTFILAFILSAIYVGWLYIAGRASWNWRNVGAAILLGGFNFGNILFYIRAQRQLADQPALVFSSINIGVIMLATLVGIFYFGEQQSKLNRIGLVLAIIAVIVLAIG